MPPEAAPPGGILRLLYPPGLNLQQPFNIVTYLPNEGMAAPTQPPTSSGSLDCSLSGRIAA